jgi:acylphosphatase
MGKSNQVQLRITGRVQGVCYRASTRDQAQRLGLTGWVRNMMDGSVEALAEGPSAVIEEFVRWCWQGPRSARVSAVERKDGTAEGNLDGFQIRY